MVISNKNINTVQDYEKVLATVAKYTKGLKTGNTALLCSVFHKEFIMYGYWGKYYTEGSTENFYESVKNTGALPVIKVHTTDLYKTPTTAFVKNEVKTNATGDGFTKYHSLVRINGE